MQNVSLKQIKILLVDEHELVREGIARLLNDAPDISIIGQLGNGEETLEYLSSAEFNDMQLVGRPGSTTSACPMPHIILLDARLPGIGSIETTRAILKKSPDYKIMAMSSMTSGIIPSQMLRSGARGFITKSISSEELLKAVRTVAAGNRYVTPSAAKRLAVDPFGMEDGELFDKLSRRELQIAHLLTKGKKVSHIATYLDISPKTVYSYRYRVFEKLGICSDVELTLLAANLGLAERICEMTAQKPRLCTISNELHLGNVTLLK